MENEHQFFSVNEEDVFGKTEKDNPGKTIFILRAFDSVSEGTVWHRAKIFALSGNLAISFYAADFKEVTISGKQYDLDDLIKKSTSLQEQKFIADAPFWQAPYENPADILLYAYQGRFLWVKIELLHKGAKFKKLRLYYPAHTFTRYLPAIYQNQGLDSFFVRFVALFQSIYLDMDEKIAQFPELLEPRSADKEQLLIIADWLSCEEFYLLPEKKRGEFLVKCLEYYKSFGTRTCMEQIIEWLCDEKPIIVEYGQVEKYKGQARIKKHYGEDVLFFTVILHKNEMNRYVKEMLDRMKPAYTKYALVELEKEFRLDNFTYLGINSFCGKPTAPNTIQI